jgi:tetratricopeptide (TPR) repeat protein
VPALLFLTSCATSDGAGEAATGQRELPPGATAPLFNDLGDHTRSVTTRSPLAQRYFDQGLVLTYGFNHAEAARSFREAQRLDPNCAMCFWGEAYVLGPNINKPMDPADAPRAREASEEALRNAASASPVERALASALSRRYAAEAPADRSGLDRAYADAMRSVARSYPDDADVQALFAEALMDTMPWDYYLPDNSPKPETVEAAAALERALEIEPNHPGAIHYYIHAMEAVTPERAEAGADRLRTLAPGAGHLVHMPSHIYLRVGRYNDASLANQKAAAADESYITQCRAQGFYPAAYYPHNIDFLAASAAFEGRSQIAIEAARKLVANIPPEQIEAIPPVEEFSPKYLYTLARFGRWETILAQPQPDPDLRYALGAWHYARGLAFAAHGQIPEARASLAEVRVARDWWEEQDMVFFSNSSPEQLLEIASLVLAARIDGAQGNWAKGVPSLEAAVTLQDALPYTEPPPWYFPTREALGDVLLRSGRPAEAEVVFRKQLEKTPRNGWSLFGLAESLRAQGKDTRKVQSQFDEAWAHADVKLEAAVL